MSKAARNRRQPPPSRRVRRPAEQGAARVVRGGTAEALEMVEELSAETEMPCRATWSTIRCSVLAPRATEVVSPVEGQRMPVLLFEPQRIIVIQDPVTGQGHEARVDAMVANGWQRVPPRYIMTGLPADGWSLYRTATGVELCDPYGCIVAEGRLASTRNGSPPP